jgi:hypothetical protein
MADADSFERDLWGEPSLVSVDLVMVAWRQIANALEPWRSMPLDDRIGELRRVLEELLDSVGGMRAPARRRRIRTVATRHGIFRRAQGCPEGALLNDFVFLRRAVRRALSAQGVSQLVVRELARTLYPDLRVARHAARVAHAEACDRFDGG